MKQYAQFVIPVFCKDKKDFQSVMKFNTRLQNSTYTPLKRDDSTIVLYKDDIKYYYIAIYHEECSCSWSYYNDFIITKNFINNKRFKLILKDSIIRFIDSELLLNFVLRLINTGTIK